MSTWCRYTNPGNGLVADTSRPGSPCSIAVVGFALSCCVIACERGWLARTQAAQQTLISLRFLLASRQSDDPQATGYRGFYYHFLDMQSGARVWNCELSLIDTTLLLAGVLHGGSLLRSPARGRDPRCSGGTLPAGRLVLGPGQRPDPVSGVDARIRLSALRLGGLQRGLDSLRARAGLARRTPCRRAASRAGPSPISGNGCWASMCSIPARSSPICFRTRGSICAASAMHSCARSAATTTRTPAAASRCSASTASAIPARQLGYGRDLWGISAGDGPTVYGAAGVRYRPSSLWLHGARCPLRTRRRHPVSVGDAGHPPVRARGRPRGYTAHCWPASRRCARNSASSAASIPASRPSVAGGCPRAGTALIRGSWSWRLRTPGAGSSGRCCASPRTCAAASNVPALPAAGSRDPAPGRGSVGSPARPGGAHPDTRPPGDRRRPGGPARRGTCRAAGGLGGPVRAATTGRHLAQHRLGPVQGADTLRDAVRRHARGNALAASRRPRRTAR